MTFKHSLAGACQLVLVRLQARADFELVRDIVFAKAPRVAAAGAILGGVSCCGYGVCANAAPDISKTAKKSDTLRTMMCSSLGGQDEDRTLSTVSAMGPK